MKRSFLGYLCSVVLFQLLTFTVHSNAATAAENKLLLLQRERYQKSLHLLKTNQTDAFHHVAQRLRNYPLYPYIQYRWLNKNLRKTDDKQIQEFLDSYANTPLAKRLRKTWLRQLHKKNQKKRFANFYAPKISTQFDCYYLLNEYRSTKQLEPLQKAKAIWLQGKSQPKACDSLFAVVINKGLITEKDAWQRFSDALANRETRLAKYIRKYFKTPALVKSSKQLIDIAYKSELLIKKPTLENNPATRVVAARSISTLAKKDAAQAVKLYDFYLKSLEFTANQQASVIKALARALYSQDKVTEADQFISQHVKAAKTDLLEWRIRKALSEQDWLASIFWISNLPQDKRESLRWRYWMAKASLAKSPTEQAERHNAELKAISSERDYYGFLAAHHLSQPIQMNDKPPIIDDAFKNTLAKTEALVRSRELFVHNDMLNAKREWAVATKGFDAQQWIHAAALAHEWGWHNRAIHALARAKYWNAVEMRFPLLHTELYANAASTVGMPSYLPMAITRQESAFDASAVSHAKAYGLMQLLPGTAKYIAKKRKLTYQSANDLFDPKTNITLGTVYYDYLLDKFNGNRVVATASYNAGPGNVGKWLKASQGKLPVDVWIETIPFNETRRYVMSVLAYASIYAHKLGVEQPLLTEQEKNTKL